MNKQPRPFSALDAAFDAMREKRDAQERLAAAAPELLAVLEKFSYDGRLQSFEDRDKFRREARAAIARALPQAGASDAK